MKCDYCGDEVGNLEDYADHCMLLQHQESEKDGMRVNHHSKCRTIYVIEYPNGSLCCLFTTKTKAKSFIKRYPEEKFDYIPFGVDAN